MKPKDKALELCQKFGWLGIRWEQTDYTTLSLENSKHCALIAVDEIKKANPIIPLEYMLESEALDAAYEYWQEVEKEIIKL